MFKAEMSDDCRKGRIAGEGYTSPLFKVYNSGSFLDAVHALNVLDERGLLPNNGSVINGVIESLTLGQAEPEPMKN